VGQSRAIITGLVAAVVTLLAMRVAVAQTSPSTAAPSAEERYRHAREVLERQRAEEDRREAERLRKLSPAQRAEEERRQAEALRQLAEQQRAEVARQQGAPSGGSFSSLMSAIPTFNYVMRHDGDTR
jgi:hypothetical protein